MRRKLAIGGGALAAVVAALAAVLLSLDADQFRGRIQTELQKKLGRPVTFGTMGLRIFPLAIRADDVSIGETPAFPTGRPFATAKQVRVRVGLLPLLKREIRVESFVLEQPRIELVRNASGRWNFSELGGGAQGGGSLELSLLEIVNGAVAVSDLAKPTSRSVFAPIDFSLRDYGPGRAFSAEAKAELPGPKGGSVRLSVTGQAGSGTAPYSGWLSLDGASLASLLRMAGAQAPAGAGGRIDGTLDFKSAGPVLDGRAALDFEGLQWSGAALPGPARLEFQVTHNAGSGLIEFPALTLKAGKLPLQASGRIDTKAATVDATMRLASAAVADVLSLARSLNGTDIAGTGAVSLNVKVQGPLGKPAWSGSGAIENVSLNVAALSKPIEVRSAKLAFDRDTARLADLSGSLGGSKVRGNVMVHRFSAPEVDFGLEADKLDLVEMQQLAATGKRASGGSPSALKARGTLKIGVLTYGDLVLNRVHSDCTFSRGVLTLAPFSAEVFGGSQTGSLTLDTLKTPPRLSLETKMDGVDADRLLSATTSIKKLLYGLLAAGGNASMSLAPGGDSARSLNGNLSIRLSKGRLAGVNLLNEMAGLGKFLGYAPRTERFTEIVQLAGDIRMKDGVASTDNMQLQIVGGVIQTAGTVNLADQTLNLRLMTVLDRDTSQKAGGSGIGGFLSTALANSNGELVIPAIVSGTFAKPRFLPDGARVAEMKLRSLIPGRPSQGGSQPAGGLLNLIDSLRGKDRKSGQK